MYQPLPSLSLSGWKTASSAYVVTDASDVTTATHGDRLAMSGRTNSDLIACKLKTVPTVCLKDLILRNKSDLPAV